MGLSGGSNSKLAKRGNPFNVIRED